ncbi:hypothetical protein [Ramlibacter humi]|uniref:Uncharacterized protein n=1 Tax=Ramlibacter humi TaxID=2530451 RepID=A0A4Z0BMU0_9BURK|nr:hypothetical protein [Ramlibacter humi]TFZ00092.1 hypothetical protein EZ216_13355 [Ramlibacter humi]
MEQKDKMLAYGELFGREEIQAACWTDAPKADRVWTAYVATWEYYQKERAFREELKASHRPGEGDQMKDNFIVDNDFALNYERQHMFNMLGILQAEQPKYERQ